MKFEFKRLREYLNHLVHTLRIEHTMATKADLDAVLATVEASASALVAEQAAAFARLAAIIAAGATTEDLQAEVDRLTALNVQLQAALAAAQDPKCQHNTKEEAQEHEASRVREEIKKSARYEIDTKKGHKCQASIEPACIDLAFESVDVRHGGQYELCPKHLDDLSWVTVGQIISSY